MTDKQKIISLLIKDYEEAIEKCKAARYEHIHDLLDKLHLSCGVCNAAKKNHLTHIYNSDWVQRHGFTWYPYPNSICNKKDIIESLQYRLKILKQEFEIED